MALKRVGIGKVLIPVLALTLCDVAEFPPSMRYCSRKIGACSPEVLPNGSLRDTIQVHPRKSLRRTQRKKDASFEKAGDEEHADQRAPDISP